MGISQSSKGEWVTDVAVIDCNARINEGTLEVISEFAYLGVKIDKNGGCRKEA